jgi:hypothetical protein
MMKNSTPVDGRKTFVQRWLDAMEADERIGPETHHVLLRLSIWANWHTGGECRPGHAQLAKSIRRKDRFVRKHIKEAIGLGWLEVVKRGYGGRDGKGRATVYQLRIPQETPARAGAAVSEETPARNEETPARNEETPARVGAAYQSVHQSLHQSVGKENSRAESERNQSGGTFTSERSNRSATKKKIPDDVRGFFDVVLEQVGIQLEPTNAIVAGVRARMAQGFSARHVGGEVDAKSWPAEFTSSPEAVAVHRLRKLDGAGGRSACPEHGVNPHCVLLNGRWLHG